MRLSSSILVRALVLAGSLALVWASVATGAVWTDKDDYSPGSVVTISGDNSNDAGYLPAETVHVDVSGPNGWTATCDAVADDAGAWSCQVTLDSNPEIAVGEYSYTATGLTSGTTENGTFTDGAFWVRAKIASTTTYIAVTFVGTPAAGSIQRFTNNTCALPIAGWRTTNIMTLTTGAYVNVTGGIVTTTPGSVKATAPATVLVGSTLYAFSSWTADINGSVTTTGTAGCFSGWNAANPTNVTANYVLASATFTVAKDFSDKPSTDTTTVSVSLSCASGIASPTSANASEATPASFTVTGYTGDPNCTATETPVPSGYTGSGSPEGTCQAALIAGGTCTITNTLNSANFTVVKDFSDKPSTDTTTVSVSLSCDSGVASPASADASEATPASFTVTGYDGDPTCPATETPVPDGYTSTGTCQAALEASGTCTITNQLAITTLSDAHLWVGLKNSDDQGTRFDLKIELYQNDVLVASGLERCVNGVTRNPSFATEAIVEWDSFSAPAVSPGDVLAFKVWTRIGTNPDGTKCVPGPGGSHNNATGLRLYYDSANRDSHFDMTLGGPSVDEYLDSNGNACVNAPSVGANNWYLNETLPTGTSPKCKDSTSINFAGGNLFKVIGTWSMTVL